MSTSERSLLTCPVCGALDVRSRGGMQLNDAKHRFTCGAVYRSIFQMRDGDSESPCSLESNPNEWIHP